MSSQTVWGYKDLRATACYEIKTGLKQFTWVMYDLEKNVLFQGTAKTLLAAKKEMNYHFIKRGGNTIL